MATSKKTTSTDKPMTHESVLKNLEPLSKTLKSTVGEVWKIFVKRYIAKGVSELFAAIVISVISVMLLWAKHRIWILAPAGVVTFLIFDAIQLLINPAYFAMNDVIDRIKKEKIGGNNFTILQ